MSGAFGKSRSQSQSQSSGFSQDFSQSFVDPAQAPFLEFLRSAGQDVTAGQIGQIGDVAGELGGTLLEQGGRAVGSVLGPAQGPGQDIIQSLQRFSGSSADSLVPSLGESNVEGVISTLGQDIERQLRRQLTGAGGIQSEAALAGAAGGGRVGVQAGIAQEGAISTFGREAAGLRNQDLARRQELGTQLAGIQAGALGTAGGLAAGAEEQRIGGQLGGLSQLGELFNLGLAPFAAEFGPLQAFASLLGDPSILGQSQGFSTSQSSATGRANSFQIAASASPVGAG